MRTSIWTAALLAAFAAGVTRVAAPFGRNIFTGWFFGYMHGAQGVLITYATRRDEFPLLLGVETLAFFVLLGLAALCAYGVVRVRQARAVGVSDSRKSFQR